MIVQSVKQNPHVPFPALLFVRDLATSREMLLALESTQPPLGAKQPEREADRPAPASGARLRVRSAVSQLPEASSFRDAHL